MAEILNLTFNQSSVAKLKSSPHTKDWPVVYLLENGKEAYIGETVSAYNRLRQHTKNVERQKLKSAHIIIDDEYNKSALLDIESWLIQYMAADKQFSLQNGNSGLSDHSYYDREKYRAKFEVLWSQLQKMGLAQMDLIQLRNSEIFKYSPYKALTHEQEDIVLSIENDLSNQKYHTYIINGDPGTGKSVLATYLAKYLSELEVNPDIKLALVIPMGSLRSTLKKVFSKIKGLKASMVITPGQVKGNYYDILIVDEAHRLGRRKNLFGGLHYSSFDKANEYFGLNKDGTQLDWILRSSKSQVLLFDENQSVTPGDIPSQYFKDLETKTFHLTSQLRVLGGDDYIKFIDDLVNMRSVLPRKFKDYDLRYFNSADDLIDAIKERNKESGLARVVAGYAWDWKTKKGEQDYDIEIDGLKLVWNRTNIDWVNSPNAINEIGCIHTVQGYDLNYVGVIIGPEVHYDKDSHRLIIDRDKYKDINGKKGIESPEELDRYIINIYKTLLTRGIYGTYIYAVDKELNTYIQTTIIE